MTAPRTAHGVIVNIRPANYRGRFHEAFSGCGWRIVDSPVLLPEPMAMQLPDAADFDAVIFTSQIAVESLKGIPGWVGKTAYAVGEATADAARRAGFARTIQTGMNASDLAAELSTASFRRAFYPSAEDVSTDVSLDDPVRIHRLAVYRMAPAAALAPEVRALAEQEVPVIIPLFSRRSARTVERLLAGIGPNGRNHRFTAVGISTDIFSGQSGPWQRRAVADKPTLKAVVDATRALIAALTSEASP